MRVLVVDDHPAFRQALTSALEMVDEIEVAGEAGGGVAYYPSHTRSWRLDLRAVHIDKSPASSSFGYYLAGLTGTIISLGSDILF